MSPIPSLSLQDPRAVGDRHPLLMNQMGQSRVLGYDEDLPMERLTGCLQIGKHRILQR